MGGREGEREGEERDGGGGEIDRVADVDRRMCQLEVCQPETRKGVGRSPPQGS